MGPSSSTPSPQRLAEAIVHDVLRRRRKGEQVSGERVLQAYPDLREVLEPMLRKADILAAAWSSSQTRSQREAEQLELQSLLSRMDRDPELPSPDEVPAASPLHAQATIVEAPPAGDQGAAPRCSDSQRTLPDRAGEGGCSAISPSAEGAQRGESSLPVKIPQRALRQPGGPIESTDGTVVEGGPREPLPTARYRPSMRHPLGLLRVLDDDQQHAQTIRLRSSEFVIGREEGDLVLSHDMQVSARHAAILRIDEKLGSHWVLRDLQSANGVYLRVERMELRPGDRFLLANAVIRFVPAAGEQPCRLEEITPLGIGDTLPLVQPSHAIGRAESCERFLQRNPMVDPYMATLRCDGEGTWSIECTDSLNGLWQRVSKADLTNGSEFQLGEQRFAFHVL